MNGRVCSAPNCRPVKMIGKRMSTGSSSVCSVGATPGIATQDINPEIQQLILHNCSHISKAVEFLVEQRNLRFAHVPEAKISDNDFGLFLKDIEYHLLGIARVCGKETNMKKNLRDLLLKPLSLNMLGKYEKLLHKNMEAINKNVASEHLKTRKAISCKLRKLEDRIESLETSSIEIKAEVQGLRKLITDRSKRSQLIRETSAEIDNHRKDQTYTEIQAVTACVQMLDNSKVLILSGREGSGKSRNSLEILRQMKDKHPEIDVIKLKRLTQFSDIIEKDTNTIVLFDDVFGRIRKHFCEDTDEQILDTLHACIRLGNIRVIFVMRNTVKHECQSLLSTHDIFCNSIAYLDLNSEEYRLSLKEKERIFINYCTKNEIDIIYRNNRSNFYDGSYAISIDEIKVSTIDKPDVSCRFTAQNKCKVFNSREVEEIIRSDPYHGFQECCRLFTKNRNMTLLGAAFFKYPFKSLLQEIENMRMEGMNNDVKGLKYVILVYILLNESPFPMTVNAFMIPPMRHIQFDQNILSINENKIDVQSHQKLFYECYNKTFALKLPDIIYLYEELTCRYLIREEKIICFQHRALSDSVLISYCKINPKAIIPLLTFKHMIDIVRLQNYMEQEEEIVIKISKPNYHELAKKIVSLMSDTCFVQIKLDRMMESKIITDNDVDLIYELVVCINNASGDTPSLLLSVNSRLHTYHYFPLYLLRNIGKLYDKRLTVNHSEDQMLISVSIRDKNISLCVDPNISLCYALKSKYIDIIIWLLKQTDHSLLSHGFIFEDLMPNEVLGYTKMLLENVNHSKIDITQLLTAVCHFKQKNALDLILNSVDNSLIDYTECIDGIMNEYVNYELIIHILEKVNHRWLNINEVVKTCCKYGCSEVVKWVLKNCDQKLFDYEELFKITIDGNKEQFLKAQFDYDNKCKGYSNILELLILQKPGIICCNINIYFEMAIRYRMNGVLELLFKHDIHKSLHVDKIIENIFKQKDDEEQYDMLDFYENDYSSNKEYCQKIIQLIKKYFLNYVNVNEIVKKAFQFGIDDIVELSLEKLDNISYYLDITLDKLRQKQLNGYFNAFDIGHGKILLLLLQRVDYKCIDLYSIMNDVCHIGHSSAVLWLLEKNPSYCFDMKYVMNKACYHGDLNLVDYLFRKYSAGDFDFKTAMIKSCRNSKRESLAVCKWLWEKLDRDVFDMKAALNNACKYDNYKVVGWILTEVDKGLFDTEAALLCACEHGTYYSVRLLLDISGINMFDFQYAFTMACRNENSGLHITQILYERANKSNLDINAVLSDACKTYRTDVIQWIIETCDQNITVTETSDGNKNFIECLDKNRVDVSRLITCILDMDVSREKKGKVDKTKYTLLLMILKKSDPTTIDIQKLLTESCKKDWIEIFKWILREVSLAFSTIREATNVACRNGAFSIVKWSLENIDANIIDLDNVMRESCGYGWLDCLDLMQNHVNRYPFDMQAAMFEACTYNRLHTAEWLLQNVSYQRFDIPLLLKEASRNGWINIFSSLLKYFQFHKSDIHIATSQALENGQLKIVDLAISKVGKEGFDFSSLSEKVYSGANKEGVVTFVLLNFDPRSIDIDRMMTNACLFGWKDIATFIIDKGLTSLCDLSLAFNTACDNGELEIAQLLLEKVDPHILTTVDKAMFSVAVKGWDEIALLLLDKVKHTRLDIGNALIEACRHGEIDVV